MILTHHRPEQVGRLIARLDSGRARFYVHLDAASPPAIARRLEAALRGRPSVRLLPRYRCTWGGFGVVRATLAGLRAALADGSPLDHVVCLSGQDYPLAPAAEIERRHAAAAGRSFLDAAALPSERWSNGGLDRVLHWHWHVRLPRLVRERPLHLHVPVRRRFPAGLRPHYGLAYWSLARAAVEYVLDYTARHPGAVRYFQRVAVPDEGLVQTILGSSPLAGTIECRPLHYVDWSAARSSPATLTMADLPALAASSCLFARKFDAELDTAVLDAIDRELIGIDADVGGG